MDATAPYRVIVDGPNNQPVVIDGCPSMERAERLKAALDLHFPCVRIEQVVGPAEDDFTRHSRIASAMFAK